MAKGYGGGMPANMGNLLKQAQKMQKQMEEATKSIEEESVTASAGGGDLRATGNGRGMQTVAGRGGKRKGSKNG